MLLSSFNDLGKVLKYYVEKAENKFCTQNDTKCIKQINMEEKAQRL